MNDHKKSEGSIDQFSTRIRARRTLEEHNEMKTFKKIVLKVWNSKSFRKKPFWLFDIRNPSEKNVFKVMTFAHVYQ